MCIRDSVYRDEAEVAAETIARHRAAAVAAILPRSISQH